MKRIVALLLIFLFMTFVVSGQSGMSSYDDQMRAILNLDLTTNQPVDFNASSLPEYRVKRTREFVRMMFVQSKEDYLAFLAATEQDFIEIKPVRMNPFKAYLEVEWHLMLAFSSSQFMEYNKAVVELLRAWKGADQNRKLLPAGLQDRLFGIMGVLFDQVPESYRKLLPVVGIDFMPGLGFERLERCYRRAKKGSLEQLENALILLVAQYEFSDDHREAWLIGKEMETCLTSNPLVGFLLSLAALKAGENETAIPLMIRAGELAVHRPGIMDYQLGRMYLYQGSGLAKDYLERFLSTYIGDNYVKSAWQKLGWYHVVQGDYKGYQHCSIRARQTKIASNDSDEQADRDMASERIPDPQLLRLRLLFDGGYYSTCLALARELESDEYPVKDGLPEIHYRMGRSLYAMGNKNDAVTQFRKVITAEEKPDSYILPYSAYYLGLISMEKGQPDKAKDYLSTCLKLNRFGYRDGIQRKAQKLLRAL